MEKLLNRFIRYAEINTRSDASSTAVPTTQSQVDFALKLAEELKEIGFEEVEYNKRNGFVTATVPGNSDADVPTIGLIAHIDTADFPAETIRPLIHKQYDGKDVLLNQDQNIVLSVAEFPALINYAGETLITTDGTTLLGADDKAGIAEIITAMEILIQDPDRKHGRIRVAFGPDEEIGTGADLFDVEHFAADFAYTIDSGTVGRLEYETFNAALATVTIKGTSVHPGTAKGRMVNALQVAAEFTCSLPLDEVPEKTEGYEGFYMIQQLEGTVDYAQLSFIIRDHSKEKFEQRKLFLAQLAAQFNQRYPDDRISLKMKDQYYNMGELIEKDKTSVDLAVRAMKELGIEPVIEAFRGGTDGSKITYMGLMTPNLFTGGENFHGKYEFITLESMEKAAKTILKIIDLNAQKSKSN